MALQFLKWLTGSALSLAATAALADFEPDPEQPYREFRNPPNPVSGLALVGLSVVPLNETIQRSDHISVRFSSHGSEHDAVTLIVEVLASDGSFRGVGRFTGAPTELWPPVPTPPDPSAGDRPVHTKNFAVMVREETHTPGTPASVPTVRVATWGGPPVDDEEYTLRFYVNSRRGDMFVVVDGADQPFPCQPVPEARTLRFDAICDVDNKDIPEDGEVELVRRDGFNLQRQTIRILR